VISAEEEVRENARRMILPGFMPLDEVHSVVAELAEDEDSPPAAERVRAIVDELWIERLAEQSAWQGLSDADRLEAAFTELEAAGVVARMAFTCCGSCGVAEIGDEVAEGAAARGFVFFHQQDAEGLAEPDPYLYLCYGAFCGPMNRDVEGRKASEEIGRLVVRYLEAHGLQVDWDGSIAQRIRLLDLDWRRRLPA
jgi:hypothetical protein